MKKIALKWYKKLNFPAEFDKEFNDVLDNFNREKLSCVDDFVMADYTAQEALVYYLYFCEEMEAKYKEHGISEEILLDTLSDILTWVYTYRKISGKLGLEECDWLKLHLSFKLFKLGRLQFCFDTFREDCPQIGKKTGENVIAVHIPENGKLIIEDCLYSIEHAKEFFSKYFPEFSYEYFTCNSWLLDKDLEEMLGENSNIVKFAKLFNILYQAESYAIIRYVFRWDATKEDLDKFEAKSTLARKIKEKLANGGKFNRGFGVIKK